VAVFFHVQKLINPIVDDEPDPVTADALQEAPDAEVLGELLRA